MNIINKEYLNDVKNRFLPLPRNAIEELEHEPNISDFEIKKELGIGSYGKVYLVNHKKTKAEYALKIINKLDVMNLEEKSYFNREIEIMYKLDHPNIIKLYSHFEDNNNCYVLMKYITNGSAYDLIPKNGRKQENFQLIASIIKDLIKALYYLHNMNPKIIHRDIKPENILLDEKNNAYLIDFGWSNYLINNRKRYSVCGSPFYLSPEMVNETGHDEKNDIWGIGVLLFELTTGKVPFEGNDVDEVRNNIINYNIKYPSDINPDAKDLICKILKENPNERLSLEQIITHNFIKKYFPNAINELIKPKKIKHKIFVVSTDNPKTWNESKPINSSNNIDNYKDINIRKTNTMANSKINYIITPIKKENNKLNKDNDRNNNINKINHKINFISYKSNYGNYKTYNTDKKNNKNTKNTNRTPINQSNHVIRFQNNISNNNLYNKSYINNYSRNIDNKSRSIIKVNFSRSEKTYNSYMSNEYDKFSILSKRYDSLKNEYESWKNKEMEKLRKELRDIDKKISQIIRQNKSCDLTFDIHKKDNLKELKKIYENLKIENKELKGKIKNYSNYFKDSELNNFRKGGHFSTFSNNILDSKTQKNINDIIKGKENEVNKYKENINILRQKEKERFQILINKYNRTLISQERENAILKKKLKELERQFR